MVHAMYLRRQAEVLVNLARATIDLGMAARLRGLAAEFRAEADEIEQQRLVLSSLARVALCPSAAVETD